MTTRRKVSVKCLYCNKQFETTLRWEGTPEQEYCSRECKLSDDYDEYGEETFEKMPKGTQEWR